MYYLDNASTTKPCAEAIAAANIAMNEAFGNPSSLHRLGEQAEAELKSAAKEIALTLDCDTDELYFTSGGTEADNWSVMGAAGAMWRKGKHIIISSSEHHAVLEPAKQLENQGWEVTYLKPDLSGRISVKALRDALRPDTVLVSIMLVNNETGAVNDIPAMKKAVKDYGCTALFHTDAVQAYLKIPMNFKSLGVDLLSISGHKVHAMKGIGALVIKNGVKIQPLLFGGGQQMGQRPGTEPVPQILSLAAAASAGYNSFNADFETMSLLKDYAKSELKGNIPDVEIIGANDAPHILCIALMGARSQGIINCLQDENVYVSAGSACSSGKRSHVLTAMDVKSALIDSSIRISLCRYSTKEDIDALVRALINAKKRLVR